MCVYIYVASAKPLRLNSFAPALLPSRSSTFKESTGQARQWKRKLVRGVR